MNLFVTYIQPFTNWLHSNPHWTLFFTFIISLSESFAIIGVIVPGSVTMTAIGILAGSGIVRLDLTLLAAILGAVCGDSLSYAIGYFYSDKILEIWPFKKYPKWLEYGKEFFARHGGKSVLFGRFIGPLRAMIPIIAGIMHMKQGRFLVANVISAIGWSLLYILPGVLIGAASSELSAESATRLFLIVLASLAIIWLLSLLIKFLVNQVARYLKSHLLGFWSALKQHPKLFHFANWITPKNEKNHYVTVVLFAWSLFSLLGFIVLLLLQVQGNWIMQLNLPMHSLAQSFRLPSLQAFLIVCSQLTSILSLTCLFLVCCMLCVAQKKRALLGYLLSTLMFSACMAYLIAALINSPAPQGLLSPLKASFPARDLSIATAFYGFIYFYMTRHYHFLTHILRSLLFILLGLSGVSAFALGDYWVSDVLSAYCLGAFICLLHCLMYRKLNDEPRKKRPTWGLLFIILLPLIFSIGLSTGYRFKSLIHSHEQYHQEYYIHNDEWWNQQQTILPIYLLNRLGKRINLLNIQYAGDLDKLEKRLKQRGWTSHNESFFTKLLSRMNTQSNAAKLPLLELLYENKRPELTMTLDNTPSKHILELRMWESDYFFKETKNPIWIGNIRINDKQKKSKYSPLLDPLSHLMPVLSDFSVKKIALPKKLLKPYQFPVKPYVVLIK